MRLFTKIVVLDEAMRQGVYNRTRHEQDAAVVPPWGTYIDPPQPLRVPSALASIRLLYAGNYGAAHDLTPLFVQLKAQTRERQTKISFSCAGMSEQTFDRIKTSLAPFAGDIRYLGRFDTLLSLCQAMKSYDFGVVSLSPLYEGLVCPSKALTYLSQGLPILYVGPSGSLSHSLVAEGWGLDLSSQIFSEQLSPAFARLLARAGKTFADPKPKSRLAMADMINSLKGHAKPQVRKVEADVP